jgi:hypothetical protein
MSLEEFYNKHNDIDSKKELIELWEKVQSKYFGEKNYIYLEWLVFRIILFYGNFKNPVNTISYMKLDDQGNPLGCAPGNKPDLYVLYDIGIILEVTERPKPGKIEHYSHISYISEKHSLKEVMGCLVSQSDLGKIPLESWNTYKVGYNSRGKLFVIADLDLLISLLDKKNPQQLFNKYIKESKNIWEKNDDWKTIRNKIIELKKELLKNGSSK